MALTAQEKTDILNLSQQALAKITYTILGKECIGDCPDADYLKAEYLSGVIRLLQTANDFTTAEFEKVLDCAAGIGEFNGFSVTTIGLVSTTILNNQGPTGPKGDKGDPGAGSGCIEYTQGIVAALAGKSGLEDCSTYYITDRYIYAQALGNDQLSVEASYLARNADYQAVGVYTGITTGNGFTVTATGLNLGVWHAGLTPAAGDAVIYNNLHWLNLLGAVGTAPDADATNWEAVPNTDITVAKTYGYIYEIDPIEYVLSDDWIQRRSDKRGNDIMYSKLTDTIFGLGSTAIDLFQWGRDINSWNRANEAYIDNLNDLGRYASNELLSLSRIYNNTTDATAVIQENVLNQGCLIFDNIMGASSAISRNTLAAGSSWIRANTLGASSLIKGNHLSTNSKFQNKTIDPSISVQDTIFEGQYSVAETISANILNKRLNYGFSNLEATLNMDTAFAAGVLTIPLALAYAGIFNITGALASYSITSVVNFPSGHPVEFKPAAGITTFRLVATAAATAVAGQIILPITSLSYNGASKERVTLESLSGIIFHNDSKQYF